MIQVQEVLNEGLKRAYTITVPKAELDEAKTERLQALAKKAKIQGFRPGKAPLDIVRQRFAAEIEGEVIDKMINKGVDEAFKAQKIRPAMRPKVDALSAEEGKDLSFKLEIEILPEIKPTDFAKLSFEKNVAEVEAKTVDETLTRIVKSMRRAEAITDARAAQMGDVAVIDFDGSVNGERQPGMMGEKHELELGSHSFIDTFEDQIVGMKVGDKKDIKVTFPKDYHAENLAGAKAVFAVTLHEIRAHREVVMDDAMAKEVGFPSLDKLRERIKGDIENNYAQISRTVLKRELMDKLADAHDFELPPTMVEREFESIFKQVQLDKKAGRLAEDDAKKSDAELEKEYRGIAIRRVRLGLLLAEVAEQNKVEVTPVELRNAMIAEARRYPGQEKAVIDYYTKTEGAVESLRAPILEEKVVDFILGKATVTDKKISAEALMKMPEDMD